MHDAGGERTETSDREYETLVQQHQGFDTRLRDLQRRALRSAAEELELTRLKKQKLRIKDRLAQLALARSDAER